MLSHFSLIPLASINLNTGPTADTAFNFAAPVSCKFARLQTSQATTSSTTGFILATVAVNGTTIVTGPTMVTAASAASEVTVVDSGASDLILNTNRVTINVTNAAGSTTGGSGINVTLWAFAKPRG